MITTLLKTGKMSLTPRDKETVKLFWSKVSNKVEEVGNNAFSRMLVVYPQTKTYFAHWSSLNPGSAPVKKHGTTVLLGIGEAVKKMDDLEKGLLTLSELHAFKLRVDPANFKLLSHCLLVVLAIIFPIEFTPEAHVAVDKFLAAVALALSDKYR